MLSPVNLTERIRDAISSSDPTPLYYQVAAVVCWEILVGRVTLGSLLPPIRSLAAEAGVNYHTIRSAYEELAQEGVVERRRGVGVRVVAAPTHTHWTPSAQPVVAATPHCWVVADNLGVAAYLSTQITRRWQVEVGCWRLEKQPPPPGPLLMPRRIGKQANTQWPSRELDINLLDLEIANGTIVAIMRNAEIVGVRRVLLIGDPLDQALRELMTQLPRVGLQVGHLEAVEPDESAITVVAPEQWHALAWDIQCHPKVMSLRWEFSDGSVARVGSKLDWESVDLA